jgi:hypothetical protein
MDPIVLIHGYSAESKQPTAAAIQKIYGTLPQALRAAYGNDGVIEIDRQPVYYSGGRVNNRRYFPRFRQRPESRIRVVVAWKIPRHHSQHRRACRSKLAPLV